MTTQHVRRSAVMAAALLLIMGLVAVLSSTYAWLNVSRVPFISDLEISVITDNSLLIAPDVDGLPGEWMNFLDASEYLEGIVPLKPTTYTPDGWMKVVYAEDGRTNGVEPISEENINVMYPTGDKTSAAAKAAEELGYIAYVDYWLKSEGSSAEVFLTDAFETTENQMGGGTYAVGTPVWNDQIVAHQNGGYGSETTLRMGFQIQHASAEGNLVGGKTFFIYEPNADVHVDPSLEGYIETPNVYDGGKLTDNAHMIVQNASKWRENSPALADLVVYEAGAFTQNQNLFIIKSGELIKVRQWFWMEGQDVDCIARAVTDAVSISSNIQFGVNEINSRDTNIERR